MDLLTFAIFAASTTLLLSRKRSACSSPPPVPRLVTLADFEAAARASLTAPSAHPGAWTYFQTGAGDLTTQCRNEAALRDGLLLRPRVLVDVSHASTAHSLLGRPTPFPFGVAPTAFHGIAHPLGEAATAAGAAAAGAPYCVSGSSTLPMEAIVAAAPGAFRFFQLYFLKDRASNAALLARAEAAGVEAIVLTVDRPVLGLRDAVSRCGFTLPGRSDRSPNKYKGCAYHDEELSDAVSWEDVAWLRSATRLPLVVKGVLRPEDGAAAVEAGCAAVWVSNHGGRQLDGVASGAEAVAMVGAAVRAAAAGRRVEVWVDGGVRRGTDVVKLLALGADFVWVGKPVVWAVAAGGAGGVEAALKLLAGEVKNALQLVGAVGVDELQKEGTEFVKWVGGWGPQ